MNTLSLTLKMTKFNPSEVKLLDGLLTKLNQPEFPSRPSMPDVDAIASGNELRACYSS